MTSCSAGRMMGLYVRRRYTFVTKASFTDAEKKDNTGKSKSRNTALSYMWVRLLEHGDEAIWRYG